MKKIHQNLKKGIWPVVLVFLLAVIVGSCVKGSSSSNKSTPVGALEVIDASPDAPSLDFYLGGTQITQSPLSLGQFTYYFTAYTGQSSAIFYQTGTKTVIGQTTVNISANTYNTLFFTNVTASPDYVFVKDTVFAPESSATVLRFANMSPDAGNVDLIVKGGSTIKSNISYKTVTSFFNFTLIKAAVLDTLQIVKTGTTTVLATVPQTSYANNGDYTIWLYGLANPPTGSSEGLQAGVMENLYFDL